MKSTHILFLMAALLLASSFKIAYDATNKTAEVAKVDGLYIFTDSEPVKAYTKLGSVTVTFGSPQYSEVRDKLIKKALKEHPSADGLILYFHTGKADRAEAIKF